MALDLTKTLVAWGLILPGSFFIGSRFTGALAIERPVMRGAVAYAIGLACLSYGVVLVSAFGWLNSPALWALLAVPAAAALLTLRPWLAWLRAAGAALSGPAGPFEWALRAVFWATCAALLAGTLAPETGGDALAYQLNLPKMFLRQSSLQPTWEDYNSFFPLLMNNLYLVGLATGGVPAAKLFHFFCGLLLFVALLDGAAEVSKRRGPALAAALAVWTMPTFYNVLSSTYNDVALAFFTFLAVYTFVQAMERDAARLSFASGVLGGVAVSVKYLGLASAVALAAVGAAYAWRLRRPGFAAKHASVWLAGLAVGCGYWLLRNGLATGNPFFPYFGSWFGAEHRPATDHHLLGMGRSAGAFLALFWNMFRHPEPFGGFPVRVGISPLLLTPFAALAAFVSPRARPYALFSAVFLAVWFFLVQAARWLLPVLPVLFLAAAAGLAWAHDALAQPLQTFARRAASWAAVGLLSLYGAAGLYHYRYAYPLYVGAWSPEEYLRKLERTASIAAWVNATLPETAKILIATEPRKFYFDRATVSDVFLRWHTRYDENDPTPSALRDFLRARGITHLLLSEPVTAGAGQATSTPLARLAASPHAQRLHTVRSENIRDLQVEYRIYELR